ncbi:sensor histidine kinase [Arcticibacter eurypsychrophilus]|uniref:sensor histidine kinase n=1 Tax=Arcticibacter eurypsychrophilus TaxID=1434752 RepID=UPI00084D04BA|nr:histidine kinase dimerization/phospho-acceptor domain-containing protein [Arcticibacter eurypsychrophilus]
MKVSFKKRIALFNTLAVAITTAIVFIVIYGVVHFSSYRHLDNDITQEKEEILNTLDWKGDLIIINKMPEWEEAEHNKVEINPTFIQIVDNKDRMVFKSANLQKITFLFNPSTKKEIFFNSQIDKQRLRLGQFPVINDDGKTIGQLTIGISQQESHNVLNNLLFTLCIAFPILLFVLYIVIYIAASKAIAPVHQLIRTASSINDSNINTRLPLPENEDELYQLANTINELLSRIEISIQQQKQFTADASHEIRTPLAGIRGTLEILIRKERDPGQYEEKIKNVIGQTDRLNQLLDQLLQLARLESGSSKREMVSLDLIMAEAALKWEKEITNRSIQLSIDIPEETIVFSDKFFLAMIADNLFSNALKYGLDRGKIYCNWDKKSNTMCIINDGPGITPEQILFLFNRFYRTDESRNSKVSGSGLGLAIVKKLTDLLHIDISVVSIAGETTFSLRFPR